MEILQETYPGLIDADYPSRLTLENCQKIAKQYLDNLLVAGLNGRIVGFVGYGACQNEDLSGCGEVFSIYILRKARKDWGSAGN